MATNKELKAALLKHLNVTPQRLSQRVGKKKQEHGPMSTEDATYVIAHQEGFDLTKYLDVSTVDRIRSIMSKSPARTETPQTREGKSRTRRQATVAVGSSIPKVNALLTPAVARDTARMAELYSKYYILENSIRIVIKRILENRYGPQWWQSRVAEAVCDKVKDRKKKESRQPWHGKRGRHEIFYSDFGDLKKIIVKNWSDFEDLFPSQPWIAQKLDELETPRNIMAHHNPVAERDLKRIDVYFHDWISLLQDRKHLIP